MSLLCVLLDLTAAFDTVDHDLLMLRLECQFGLRGVILQWFSSYLSDRTFQVVFRSGTSSVVIIICSVPQGSVLGPRLLILYTADLADVVKAHNLISCLIAPVVTTASITISSNKIQNRKSCTS